MRKLVTLVYLLATISFVGCSGNAKKVLVMASGDIEIKENVITLNPGTTHNEKEFQVSGNKITVNSPDGSVEIDVPDAGLYLLNLKKDTLIGSYQRVGTSTEQIKLTRDDLKHRLDSMVMLMQGQNVSAENRNFWIPPMKIAKITTNTQAQIVGPYRNLPGSFDPDKEHEIYKFHTNKEASEIVEKIRPMTESSLEVIED